MISKCPLTLSFTHFSSLISRGWKDLKVEVFFYQQCVQAKLLQLCLTLCTYAPGSFVPGILRARIAEWVTIPSSRRSSRPRDWTHISCGSCIAVGFFTTEPPGKPSINNESESEVAQSCPTLCNPMDCNLPRSSIHGIFQARVLEWVSIKTRNSRMTPHWK